MKISLVWVVSIWPSEFRHGLCGWKNFETYSHKLNKFTPLEAQFMFRKKWNEWGFMPPLCTYRLNWARRASWGWWDNTAHQTHNFKFGPWRPEADHATSRSRSSSKILNLYDWAGKKHCVSLNHEGQSGIWTRDFRLCKQADLTTVSGPPQFMFRMHIQFVTAWCSWLSLFTADTFQIQPRYTCSKRQGVHFANYKTQGFSWNTLPSIKMP